MSVCNMPSTIKETEFHELINNSRSVHYGDQETRLKQLHSQIEQLSLSNARLARANRNLKLDVDKIVEEKTHELKQALKLSIEQNIRLQRSNRLLKDEFQLQSEELNNYKKQEIWKMKNVGPEYEYLVQVINLLYRQLSSTSHCKTTCCYTEATVETEHKCRPIIKSHTPQASMESRLEQENYTLRNGMDILINDRDNLYLLLKDKEEDNETLKHELTVKDNIVKQLEHDFEKMELEVDGLQKNWSFTSTSSDTSDDNNNLSLNRSPDSSFSELHSMFPSVPIT